MNKLLLITLLAAVLGPALPTVASAQTVRRVSRTARGSANPSRRSRSRRNRRRRSRDGGSADAATVEALLYPFLGPVFATGDRWGPEWWLADHPYADGVPGYAVHLPIADVNPISPPVQDVAISVGAEGGYVLGQVARSAVEVRLMLPHRIEIDASSTVLAEPESGSPWTWAAMETLHLGLRFAQDEHWQFHTALGARVFHDAEGVLPGFDFRYQVDVFPVRPLVVSMRVSLGNLDRALTVGGRITVGLAAGPVEFFVGYDHLSFVDFDDEANTAHLSGPLGGLRFWI